MSRLNPNAGAFVPSFSVPATATPAAPTTAAAAPSVAAATTVAASKSPAKATKPAPIATAQETTHAAKTKATTPSGKQSPPHSKLAIAAAAAVVEGDATLDDVDMDNVSTDRLVYSIDYLLQFQSICDTVPCYFPDVVRAPAPPRLGRYMNDRLVYSVPELLHFQPLYQMFPPDLEWSETLAIVVESMDKKDMAPTKPSKKEKAKAKAAAAAAAAAASSDQLQYDPTLMCYFNPTEYAAALSMAVYGSSSTTGTGANTTDKGGTGVVSVSVDGKIAADSVNLVEEAAVAKRRLAALLEDVQPGSVPDMLKAFETIEISCTHTLQEVISQLFDRAIAEPTLCDAYAQLCSGMAERTPEFKEGAKTINFRRILLTRCYEALIEEPETTALVNSTSSNTANGNATTLSSMAEAAAAVPQHSWRRQCMLQNVCLIGELFRRQLLTENVMHVCVAMMLEDEVHPQMDVIEAACRLLMLVGDLLDGSSPASRRTMDEYFDVLQRLADHSAAEPSLKETITEMTSVRAGGWTKKRFDASSSPAKANSATVATPLVATAVVEGTATLSPNAAPTDATAKSVSAASS